jgi:hypothetical protein
MTPDLFRELLVREPFLHLRLHLNSGEIVDIDDPSGVLIRDTTLQIFTTKRDHNPIIDTNRYVPLRAIAQVEQKAPA